MKLLSMLLVGSALMFSGCGMMCKKSCDKNDSCCKEGKCSKGENKKDAAKDAKKVEEKKKS